ncbi:flavin reductase family protein [Mycolicibacterium llatzerense]|uniref:flavin reductase family protein n=1 Tax=Mycolicibacterium llatzerense TaxID=280871 RepID=UPI0021B59BF1|nr:flavin reductase family protein [Mycolicibacterium llatzerense]MCT7362725.1 oxidoreductase [Mycolicibacterium llatzerense]
METLSLDSAALRAAFAHFPSGVIAVCADTETERIGMAASTFMPVSLDPPLVAFCVQNTSLTWPRLAAAPRLGISVLSAAHGGIVRTLAAKDGDRFAGVETETLDGGALLIADAVVAMDVTVTDQIRAGDHTIVVMQINDLHAASEPSSASEPIVFHRSTFRTLTTTS